METDFLASGNRFLPFSQTVVNCCQWKLFFLQLDHIFSQSFIPASENEFFVYWKQCFLIPSFFLLMENNTEIWGSQILKTNHIPARVHQFFLFFQIFFKVEAVLPYCKSVFFNILYPASANEFSACGNSVVLVETILLLLEIIIKR